MVVELSARTLFNSGRRYASLLLRLLSAKYFRARLKILLSLSQPLTESVGDGKEKSRRRMTPNFPFVLS
jgi:hypothetical protein